MKKSITVAIYDNDRYFRSGLEFFLTGYFLRRGIEVRFDHRGESEVAPTLAFGAQWQRYRHHAGCVRCNRYFLTIKNRPKYRLAAAEHGVIYRDISIDQLALTLVRLPLDEQLPTEPCRDCRHEGTLSQRERQVVRYMRSGLSQSEVAARLELSVKTVHTHKRSIMQKMELRRKHEFIYWLLG
ncbi:LuxR C-terminal-related transcriptional regulator [Serratia nevei]|uniref:helix-turn-helix transcriptional regulator n=1 Tax=Serratia nevei TaxID=2703794 RepID=UPI0020A2174A|nr:LuxR C-terminal-related transcriptional regulator [Serratia nevei]MCP1107093.1 LuxR C-terminal-related transcriptional regulator [Serratia nevei]